MGKLLLVDKITDTMKYGALVKKKVDYRHNQYEKMSLRKTPSQILYSINMQNYLAPFFPHDLR